MTLKRLILENPLHQTFIASAGDPMLAIETGYLLDSQHADIRRMRTKPSDYPWGFFKLSRDRRWN